MKILFLCVGERHQLFHSLPIAAEMQAAHPELDVQIALACTDHLPLVRQVIDAYPGFSPPIRHLPLPAAIRGLRRLGLLKGQQRTIRLLAALAYLRRFDAIVVPERTTTKMRHLLGRKTRLIFTPHGAGDRAVTFDRRDRYFDFALVAGPKSERRMLDEGTIRPGAYAVTGYVKLDFMRRLKARRRLFDNDRPTVLYAPHFRSSLSSWDGMALPIIRAFAAQDRYNLIVAPHIRLFDNVADGRKAAIEALAIPGKIIIDLDSERLVDMSYTCGADIYLGDVSSQVYEFLVEPRPCVFVNAHKTDWRCNPDYLFWTLGDVVDDPAAILPAIDAAPAQHPLYVERQRHVLADSIGDDFDGAALRAANAVIEFLQARPVTTMRRQRGRRKERVALRHSIASPSQP